MGLSVGIVGLPNVGIVPVVDQRLVKIAELASSWSTPCA